MFHDSRFSFERAERLSPSLARHRRLVGFQRAESSASPLSLPLPLSCVSCACARHCRCASSLLVPKGCADRCEYAAYPA